MDDWKVRARTLAADLVDKRWLTDPGWREAIASTPRHLFIPRFWYVDEEGQPLSLVDGADPARLGEWLDAVYADRALITEWAGPAGHRTAVSSASMPGVISLMLEALDLRPGQRVLEVGTGTGYNTALMRTRTPSVTSIDIDADLVEAARGRLDMLGRPAHLVAGDGAGGVPADAPYDRIIVTCAAPTIPPAWIDQLTPGGRIVAPMTFGGALAVVDKVDAGRVSGAFSPVPVGFVPLRSASVASAAPAPAPPATKGTPGGEGGELAVPVKVPSDFDLATFGDSDFRLWLDLAVPGVHLDRGRHGAGSRSGVVVLAGERRAVIDPEEQVVFGDVGLYERIEHAWQGWYDHGRPVRSRMGLTATASGVQYAWLDTPDSPVRWPVS